MPNVKLWSILLTIFLTVIHYEQICSSYNYKKFAKYIQSGKIGCIFENLCLKSEKCINDYLFGKCVHIGATTSRILVKAPSAAIDFMAYIIRIFGSNIDWQNPKTQCVLQNIISRPNVPSEEYAKRIAYSCTTDTNYENEVDEIVNAGEVALDESNAYDYYLRPREEEYVDTSTDKVSKYILASNNHHKNGRIIAYIPYTIETEQSRPFQKTQKSPFDFASKYNRSNTNRQTNRDTEPFLIIPIKRRYRLVLPVDTEPLRPPTKSWVWVRFYGHPLDTYGVQYFLKELSRRLTLASPITHYFFDRTGKILYFHVPTNTGTDAESVGSALKRGVGNFGAYYVADIGFGRGAQTHLEELQRPMKSYTTVLIICLSITVFCVIIFLMFSTHFCWTKLRAHSCKNSPLVDIEKLNGGQHPKTVGRRLKRLFKRMIGNKIEDNSDGLISTDKESIQNSAEIGPSPTQKEFSRSPKVRKGPTHIDSLTSQSSTSSWSSEPVSSGIDITMGHLILSYMENYIHNRDKLVTEWDIANSYESEEATPCADAEKMENESKNRSSAPAPYEQSRVRLRNTTTDYINASLLYDHNPRNPGYIATPTPTASTAVDFWTMVWEQSCAVLVCLERSSELKQASTDEPSGDGSVQYWPNEGKVVCGQFEIHLVSEHSWCENYVVRSFYLKTLETEETRTVTQFHYLTWTDENLLTETRQLLEFRRKVNRSFRGMMSPIVVHCFDGCGRTGTYILLDLVLNRITKGLKEINIAASLEHLRDQRQKMVQNKEQYEFVFTAVAREVDAMLKAHHQTPQ